MDLLPSFRRGRGLSLGSLLLACWAGALATALADDWPRRRGPGDNGVSRETDWSSDWGAEGPRKLWETRVGVGFSGVIVSEGRAFTQGNENGQDVVVAVDAVSGRELWRHAEPEPLQPKMYEGGPNSTPTAAEGLVLVASRSGVVRALEGATGALRWRADLRQLAGKTRNDWGLSGAPLVVGSRVALNYGSGATLLNLSDGTLAWTMGGGNDNSFCSPVLFESASGPLLLMHMKKALLGVPLTGGKPVFRHAFGKGFETHCADPVLTGQGVFISSGDDGGELLQVDGTRVSRRWKNGNLGTFTGTAVHLEGHLYGLDAAAYQRANQALRCVSVADGEVKWTLPGFGQGSLIAAGDRLLVLSDQGELAVVRARPERAEVLARAQVLGGKCWTQPALADGRLHLRNARGDWVCLGLKG